VLNAWELTGRPFRVQSPTGHFLQQLLFRESSGSELSKDLLNNRSSFGVGDEALAIRPWNVDVADGGEECPSSQFEGGLHPCTRAIRPHVIVELREGREYALHQLARGCVVDRLGRRPQRDAQRFQMRPQREVVVLLASEPRQIEDDNHVLKDNEPAAFGL